MVLPDEINLTENQAVKNTNPLDEIITNRPVFIKLKLIEIIIYIKIMNNILNYNKLKEF